MRNKQFQYFPAGVNVSQWYMKFIGSGKLLGNKSLSNGYILFAWLYFENWS